MITKSFLLPLAITVATFAAADGQSPNQIVVQAMPASTPAPAVAAAPAPVPSNGSTVKILEQIKAANAAILEKQTATLQQLDEMEKAAEQIKIYSKRG